MASSRRAPHNESHSDPNRPWPSQSRPQTRQAPRCAAAARPPSQSQSSEGVMAIIVHQSRVASVAPGLSSVSPRAPCRLRRPQPSRTGPATNHHSTHRQHRKRHALVWPNHSLNPVTRPPTSNRPTRAPLPRPAAAVSRAQRERGCRGLGMVTSRCAPTLGTNPAQPHQQHKARAAVPIRGDEAATLPTPPRCRETGGAVSSIPARSNRGKKGARETLSGAPPQKVRYWRASAASACPHANWTQPGVEPALPGGASWPGPKYGSPTLVTSSGHTNPDPPRPYAGQAKAFVRGDSGAPVEPRHLHRVCDRCRSAVQALGLLCAPRMTDHPSPILQGVVGARPNARSSTGHGGLSHVQ